MTPDRRDDVPEDLRAMLAQARPDQLRRLLADVLAAGDALPAPTHTPRQGGRLN